MHQIDWLNELFSHHVRSSTVILRQQIRESHSLHIHIYILWRLWLLVMDMVSRFKTELCTFGKVMNPTILILAMGE